MKKRFFNEPQEIPKFPETVSTLTSQELADLHALYLAWYAFIADKLKLFTVEETRLSFELGVILRKGLVSVEGKTMKEKEIKVKSRDNYLELEAKWSEKNLVCLNLKSELDILEKMFMALRSEMRRREV